MAGGLYRQHDQTGYCAVTLNEEFAKLKLGSVTKEIVFRGSSCGKRILSGFSLNSPRSNGFTLSGLPSNVSGKKFLPCDQGQSLLLYSASSLKYTNALWRRTIMASPGLTCSRPRASCVAFNL